jgi:hypothetical protein
MYEVIYNKELYRYIVVDKEAGEVLDDAQGYGYKTAQGAHKAYAYKTRDKSKDGEKAKKQKVMQAWCRENKEFVSELEDAAFDMAKGGYGAEAKFDAAFEKKALEEAGYSELPFTASEFVRFWKKN